MIIKTITYFSIIKDIFDEAKSDKLNAAVGLNYHNPSKTLTICTWNKSIYLFDLTNPSLMEEGKIGELLEAEHVLKVKTINDIKKVQSQ